MRRLPATGLAVLALVVGGCGGGSKNEAGPPEAEQGEVSPSGGRSDDERVIRGWNRAVNRGDYGRAADFFAPGAIVEQLTEMRLDTRAEAVAFNRGLPCRADVTDAEEGDGATIAAFSLREGRTGDCQDGGSARVRFVIGDGEIEEWRQLPPPVRPPGDPV